MTTPNWIKMRTDLRNHPKVVRMASALKADRLRIVGGLWAVWSIFDTHSADGLLEGYTLAVIDEDLGWRGFAAAMAAVQWLDEEEGGLVIPDFDEHNGASAKRRASDTKRKQAGRESDPSYAGSWNDTGQMSASDADKKQTRVRVERESNTPLPPAGGDARFDRFWSAYPRKVGKDAARKAFAKRRPDDALLATMLAAIAAQRLTPGWTKDGGQFIPHPSTWLNEGRWQDETAASTPSATDFAGVI